MGFAFHRSPVVAAAIRIGRPAAAAMALAFVLAGVPVRALALSGHIDVPEVKTALPMAPGADAIAWNEATSVSLGWDLAHIRPASEPTTARIATDGKNVYVRFDVVQQEPISASQRTNDVGLGSDDQVWVDLWPDGASGFYYQFVATPNGTHYESSSENAGYQPTWESAGAVHDGGYTVTMKIPVNVIRGAKSGAAWRAQFGRLVHASGEEQVWTHGDTQTSPDDLAFAGSMNVISAASHPQPRLAMYGLGTIASRSAGGSTSRAGADLSVPLTPTAAFYATVHPDFSNVELDQQSISPSVFQRRFNEVRPFFTQGSNFFNNFNCNACTFNVQEFYTPAVPTPREGYAIEGQQGPLGFAALDAVGAARNDQASVLDYTSPDLKWTGTVQRVAVTTPTVVDDVTTSAISYFDHKHFSAYFDYGSDSGTNVLQGDNAQRYDFGSGWQTPTFAFYGGLRKIGDDYNPVDGLVQHPGIAGYSAYADKLWLFKGNTALSSISLGADLDRYHGSTGGLDQTDNALALDILTKSLIDLNLQTGSNYLRLPNGIMTPVSQNGITLIYHSGSGNSINNGVHGPSANPTTIAYYAGRYGDGRLDTWTRISTIRAGMRGTITLELDDTKQWFAKAATNTQWFERLGYVYQLGHDSSFAAGLRRIEGNPPVPNGGGNCVGVCTNLSFSYHVRKGHSELYLGYGDPNTLTTAPQAILKLIFYAGADKGT